MADNTSSLDVNLSVDGNGSASASKVPAHESEAFCQRKLDIFAKDDSDKFVQRLLGQPGCSTPNAEASRASMEALIESLVLGAHKTASANASTNSNAGK